jgi:hypothetical protein
MKLRNGSRWTEEEVKKLSELIKNKELTYYELSEIMGRTPKSIKWKLKSMKYPKETKDE